MAPRKLPVEWHECIRALHKGGVTQVQMARALDVSVSRVRQVCNRYDNVQIDGRWGVRKVLPVQPALEPAPQHPALQLNPEAQALADVLEHADEKPREPWLVPREHASEIHPDTWYSV